LKTNVLSQKHKDLKHLKSTTGEQPHFSLVLSGTALPAPTAGLS